MHSPEDRKAAMLDRSRMSAREISEKHGIPEPTIARWISEEKLKENAGNSPVLHAGIVRAGDTFSRRGLDAGPFAWDLSKGILELRGYGGPTQIYRHSVAEFRRSYTLIKANPKGQLLLTAQDV